jgi:putative nucleotidyltransferase with HDIG domain
MGDEMKNVKNSGFFVWVGFGSFAMYLLLLIAYKFSSKEIILLSACFGVIGLLVVFYAYAYGISANLKDKEKKKETLDTVILKKIDDYKIKNGLGDFAKSIILRSHETVIVHEKKVALLAEAIAEKMLVDSRLAFFAGLMHDAGKLALPSHFFDERTISQEEYSEIKKHAVIGFEMLREDYLFTALCVGLHHAVYDKGYGLTIEDFPEYLPLSVRNNILKIATIVSIADFIEAYSHRVSIIMDGSDMTKGDLKSILYEKYPKDIQIIDIALEEFPKIQFWND